jgi:hypothetical protein
MWKITILRQKNHIFTNFRGGAPGAPVPTIFICCHMPTRPAYGVYMSQLVWYSRGYCSYRDVIDRGLLPRPHNHHFESLHHLDNCYGIFVSQIIKQVSLAVVTIQSTLHLSWPFTALFIRETRRMSLVVQEILTIPEHTNSPSVFSGVIDAHYLVFCDCLSFCLFFFWPFYCLSFN